MEKMKGILIENYPENMTEALAHLKPKSVELPELKSSEVLVKMEAAPCNPSDLMFLTGQYGVTKSLPTIPGWEGTGTVIKAGGLLSRWLVGRRVACGGQGDGYGTWAEYFVADSKTCIPLNDKVKTADAACFVVNPFTAYAMVDIARKSGHKAIVKTAAASQLGRIVNVMAADKGLDVINIIRRDEQAKILKDQGCKYTLNQNDPDFSSQLQGLCKQLKATVSYEAVGGKMSGDILAAMPDGATLYLYGALSGEALSGIHPLDLIFKGKSVTGLYLGEWMKQAGLFGLLKAGRYVSKLFTDGKISTAVQKECGLSGLSDALAGYNKNMTDGKVILRPFSS